MSQSTEKSHRGFHRRDETGAVSRSGFLDIPPAFRRLMHKNRPEEGDQVSATSQTYWQESRRWMIVVIVAASIVLGYLVGVAEAADDRLHAADDHLTKAIVLLQATDAGVDTGDDREAREVQRHVDRAIASAEKTRAEIAKAIAVTGP